MDIRFFAQRSHAFAAPSGRSAAAEDTTPVNNASQAAQAVQNAQVAQRAVAATEVAAPANDNSGTPATEATAKQPATMSHFSPAGRLLNMLQSFEQRHPDETKQVLSNIADKLRADSENAGVFSGRLEKWADRFQKAAETGDMSNLMPRLQSHFGVRAYQQNQQAAPETDETVEHVAGVAASASQAPAAPAATSGTGADKAPSVSTEPATATAAAAASTSTAPQKSSLGEGEGASDMRSNNQSPPIIAPQVQ